MTRKVAIVGAGAAGCATAYGLATADADVQVTVFERRDEPGGRAATRSRDGVVYDVGANYLKSDDDRVTALVRDELGEGLDEVDDTVWTVDGSGRIEPGDDRDEHKLTYREGMAVIGDRLLDRADTAAAGGIGVEYDVGVTRIEREGTGWLLETTGGPPDTDGGAALRTRGPFDAVVLTPPAPLVADLLAASPDAIDVPTVARLRRAAGAVSYRPIASVALAYDRRLQWPCYAIVDVSKTRDLGWVGREECKPGHVPEGRSLLVAQASPEWTRSRAGASPDAVADAMAELVAELACDRRLRSPVWSDVVRWRHALADDAVPPDVVDAAAEAGIVAAGDWVAGEARIHAALASGLDAADRPAEK